MAWTAPRTWVTGETVTAALLNTHLRDNLNVFTTGSDGDYFVTQSSAPETREILSTENNASAFTFTNTSYLDLDAVTGGTAGTACSVSISAGAKALVFWRCNMSNDTSGSTVYLSPRVSNSTTLAASDQRAISFESSQANDKMQAGSARLFTVNSGTNNFELQARVDGGTGAMNRTELIVMAF